MDDLMRDLITDAIEMQRPDYAARIARALAGDVSEQQKSAVELLPTSVTAIRP